jgi:hypothetical protein
MYLFVDTEFTNFIHCDLISLGIVSEDGQHELYFEIIDHNAEWQSDFVRAVVVPMLDSKQYGLKYDDACVVLKRWIDGLPASEVNVVADYGMDLHLMGELLIDNKPEKRVNGYMLEKAFRQVLHDRGFHVPQQQHIAWRSLMNGIEDYFEDVDKRRHHALADAKANRHGWLKGLSDAARA